MSPCTYDHAGFEARINILKSTIKIVASGKLLFGILNVPFSFRRCNNVISMRFAFLLTFLTCLYLYHLPPSASLIYPCP